MFEGVAWEKFPPTRADVLRLRRYRRNTRLFDGEGTERDMSRYLGARLFGADARRKIGIIVNYPGMIARVAADFLFGEAPQFQIAAPPVPAGVDPALALEEANASSASLRALVEDNDLPTVLYESALSAASDGDTVLRARLTTDETDRARVVVEEVPAENYFVTTHPDDPRRVIAQHVAWIRADGQNKPLALLVETHLPGWIYLQAFKLSGDGVEGQWAIGEELDLAELYSPEELAAGVRPVTETRVTRSLVEHVPNYRTGKRYFGISDYHDLDTLFDSVNNRMSRIDQYLDKHSRPKLVLPAGMLGPDGNVADADVFEPLSAELAKALPRYVTWDGQMESSFTQLEHLTDAIFKISEIAPAVFGLDKAGSIESGRAMRMRFIRTVAKINRKRTHYDRGLKRILRTALDLQAAWVQGAPAAPGAIEVLWADGMPQDYIEAIDAELKRVQGKLGSRRQGIRNIDLVGDDAAEKELVAIAAEEAKFGAPSPAPAAPRATEKQPSPA